MTFKDLFQTKLCYDSVKILCRVRSEMVTANLGDNERVGLEIRLPSLCLSKSEIHVCVGSPGSLLFT